MLGGAAILARRQMIEEVGGFDERFHMYACLFDFTYSFNQSEAPTNMKPSAVFAFMVANPGRTLFREGMPNCQPISTRQPNITPVIPAVCEMFLNEV
jgi:hypothetical protein